MNLQSLFSIFPGVPENTYSNIEIQGIYNNSNDVQSNSVFVAVRGHFTDGHNYISNAIEKGAIALVVENRELVPPGFSGFVLVVPETRTVLDILAARFYKYPANNLFCVGVTGTNGKTSLCYLIESILNFGGLPTGVIGTVDHHFQNEIFKTQMTTPDALELQKRLADFRDRGARAVTMEVTSHALDQRRIDSVGFNTVVFTNLTHDHLDFHRDMKQYFEAKQRLFTDLVWKSNKCPLFAIVNTDDAWGRKLKIADPAHLWTYGTKDADFEFQISEMDLTHTNFNLKTPSGSIAVKLPLVGLYNVYNSVAALAVGLSAGVKLEICKRALESFSGVPGRLQRVPNPGEPLQVYVDYAHTPDALENVLRTVRQIDPGKRGGRLFVLFGCGGDRDKTKRAPMGIVANRYADLVYVTSDNPRTEDPIQILQDICSGFSTEKLNFDSSHPEIFRLSPKIFVHPNRAVMIEAAIQELTPHDVLIIAGKGHEDYQIIGTQRIPFDDRKTAAAAMRKRANLPIGEPS